MSDEPVTDSGLETFDSGTRIRTGPQILLHF